MQPRFNHFSTSRWQVGFAFLSLLLTVAVVTPVGSQTIGGTGIPVLAGDYNADGKVDAADFVIWRKNLGTNNVLPNDPQGGLIASGQLINWRANFGKSSLSAASTSQSAIPEPASWLLLLSWLALDALSARRR